MYVHTLMLNKQLATLLRLVDFSMKGKAIGKLTFKWPTIFNFIIALTIRTFLILGAYFQCSSQSTPANIMIKSHYQYLLISGNSSAASCRI